MNIPIVDVKRLGNGWYSFANVPQSGYIKIDGLNCGDDKKAAEIARKLTGHSATSVCFS